MLFTLAFVFQMPQSVLLVDQSSGSASTQCYQAVPLEFLTQATGRPAKSSIRTNCGKLLFQDNSPLTHRKTITLVSGEPLPKLAQNSNSSRELRSPRPSTNLGKTEHRQMPIVRSLPPIQLSSHSI